MSGLLGFVRGMNKAAADTVAGPVDLITAGLLRMGVPMPANPVGGSQWMRQQGLVQDPAPGMAGVMGEAAGMVSPIVAAAKAPQIARGLLKMGENAAAPRTLNGPTRNQAGAVVWHGSPHKFDKFDSAKIGTGEGKQQQGVGLYFAENPRVAQKYADRVESGTVYKVDLPDPMIERMANYDAPLRAQPRSVRDAVGQMLDADTLSALRSYHGWDNADDAPFASVLDALEIAKGNNRAATSEALRASGVPGLRYLDGGSRGAGTGTSNYVVFPGNEGLLRILGRE